MNHGFPYLELRLYVIMSFYLSCLLEPDKASSKRRKQLAKTSADRKASFVEICIWSWHAVFRAESLLGATPACASALLSVVWQVGDENVSLFTISVELPVLSQLEHHQSRMKVSLLSTQQHHKH